MDIERLKQCGIDYDSGIHRFCDNKKMYEKYLRKFTEIKLYDELKQSIAAGDTEQAFECCHKLKAFIGNLSIPELFDNVCTLTELLREETPDAAKVNEQLILTEGMYKEVIGTLEEEL